jgi:hypothetical protein
MRTGKVCSQRPQNDQPVTHVVHQTPVEPGLGGLCPGLQPFQEALNWSRHKGGNTGAIHMRYVETLCNVTIHGYKLPELTNMPVIGSEALCGSHEQSA